MVSSGHDVWLGLLLWELFNSIRFSSTWPDLHQLAGGSWMTTHVMVTLSLSLSLFLLPQHRWQGYQPFQCHNTCSQQWKLLAESHCLHLFECVCVKRERERESINNVLFMISDRLLWCVLCVCVCVCLCACSVLLSDTQLACRECFYLGGKCC